jgi:2-deoxy-D-gluconate 3-dehydrogenase
MGTMSNSLPALFSLEGQTALITGGTRGIGAAMATALAEAGADIVMIQRSKADVKTKETIEALGRKCTIYVADLASQSNLVSVIPTILEEQKRIHILLNCGGIQRRHPAEMFPDEDWNDVIQVNLTSVFTLAREVGGHMLKQEPMDSMGRRGVVINVASLLSFQGGITVPAYAASKGGVAQLTKALSNDWSGKGINVNAIAPGYIATEMNEALMKDQARASSILGRIPAGRWGSPEDFKGAVVYLASRASGYVSGEILVSYGDKMILLLLTDIECRLLMAAGWEDEELTLAFV